MRRSEELQRDVVDELAFDPEVDSSEIAVTATEDGVVTLKGSVSAYMQLRAAERALKRVRGVKAVANDLAVHVVEPARTQDDTAIAEAALQAVRELAGVRGPAVQSPCLTGVLSRY